MNIECLLKRPGGTRITLGATAYHFKPDDLDRHVALVENPDHSKVLLSIKEGYRSLDPLPAEQISLEAALAALRHQFPDADLSQITVSAAAAAPETAAPVIESSDQADEQSSAAPESAEKTDGGIDAPAEPSAFADMSEDDLRAEFEKLLGRKPHHKMLRETMEAQIIAALNGAE